MSQQFIASYSGGKDSILAIHRAVRAGLSPMGLLTTYNIDRKRSWFHGIPQAVLQDISASLDIPIHLIQTSSSDYAARFEQALRDAKQAGAQICVFGDIDIEGHRVWCTERCAAAGLQALFPLWGESRSALVRELIDANYTAHFTVIDTQRMQAAYLGKRLTHESILALEGDGVDACGENGEYHSFVSDGPLFHSPVPFRFGEAFEDQHYAILPILPLHEET